MTAITKMLQLYLGQRVPRPQSAHYQRSSLVGKLSTRETPPRIEPSQITLINEKNLTRVTAECL